MNDLMARALKPEEAEVFKDAIFPERRFAFDGSCADGLMPGDDEMDPNIESAFWLSSHFPTTNS